MDPRLHVAACNGDVGALQKLLQEDPLVLSKATISTSSDSPLHIAAILGHTDFAKSVISRNPELSRELNHQGYTPIHLASFKGQLQVVTELLNFDKGLCFVKDSEGRTPLHCAAIKGRVEVITHLMGCSPESAMGVTFKGETLLHLVVSNSQTEVMMLLISSLRDLNLLHKLIDSRDEDGKTALQLAIAKNQNKMTKMLASETKNGDEIIDHETNKQAVVEIDKNQNQMTKMLSSVTDETKKKAVKIDIMAGPSSSGSGGYELSWKDRLSTLHNTIIVVCSLFATCCFEAIISPPGGVWQNRPSKDIIHAENIKNISAFQRFFLDCNTTLTDLLAPNKAMSMALQPKEFLLFIFFDVMCFLTSLATIYLVTVAVCIGKKGKLLAFAVMLMLHIVIVSAIGLYASIIRLTSNADAFVSVIWDLWQVILIPLPIIIFAPDLKMHCLRPISSRLASCYSRLRVQICNRYQKMIARCC
ncbi:hypothetical protein QYF36_005039 [Acer negundo]|nr:hypothetical protein QYF36_005039 [Acer negundo]